MRGKVIPDQLATLHHESNSLQFGNVGDWVSSDGNEISKFPYSIAPTRSSQPNISAAFVVTARMMSSGGIPELCKVGNIITVAWPRVFPGENQHRSEDPAANFTPEFNTR
jgi:hypothetical protein